MGSKKETIAFVKGVYSPIDQMEKIPSWKGLDRARREDRHHWNLRTNSSIEIQPQVRVFHDLRMTNGLGEIIVSITLVRCAI